MLVPLGTLGLLRALRGVLPPLDPLLIFVLLVSELCAWLLL